jgi:hypothetical protein
MYVSRATRVAIAGRDQQELSAQAKQADEHFIAIATAWEQMRPDAHVLALLDLHDIPPLVLERSTRRASNGSHDGVMVLERVVLEALASRILSKADLVGWLAKHHAGALSAIQAVSDGGRPNTP